LQKAAFQEATPEVVLQAILLVTSNIAVATVYQQVQIQDQDQAVAVLLAQMGAAKTAVVWLVALAAAVVVLGGGLLRMEATVRVLPLLAEMVAQATLALEAVQAQLFQAMLALAQQEPAAVVAVA
jgi:hypothetical protein